MKIGDKVIIVDGSYMVNTSGSHEGVNKSTRIIGLNKEEWKVLSVDGKFPILISTNRVHFDTDSWTVIDSNTMMIQNQVNDEIFFCNDYNIMPFVEPKRGSRVVDFFIGISIDDAPCMIEYEGNTHFVPNFDPNVVFKSNHSVNGLFSVFPPIDMDGEGEMGYSFSDTSRIAKECKVIEGEFEFKS